MEHPPRKRWKNSTGGHAFLNSKINDGLLLGTQRAGADCPALNALEFRLTVIRHPLNVNEASLSHPRAHVCVHECAGVCSQLCSSKLPASHSRKPFSSQPCLDSEWASLEPTLCVCTCVCLHMCLCVYARVCMCVGGCSENNFQMHKPRPGEVVPLAYGPQRSSSSNPALFSGVS